MPLHSQLLPIGIIVAVVVILLLSVRICNQWQRKVVLRLGRFAGVRGPGFFLIMPIFEWVAFTIDLRVITSGFSAEQTLTKDNVPVNVDTVLYWKVVEPEKAVLQVANYYAAVMGIAQTSLRDIIGRTNLSEVLSDRAELDRIMTEILDRQTEPWGIKVQAVLMRDIKIPESLQDAMSRVAQADRERQARMLLGESEIAIAQQFSKAGDVYSDNAMALHLRGMNMLFEVMKAGGTSTVIIPSQAVQSMSFGTIAGITAAEALPGVKPITSSSS